MSFNSSLDWRYVSIIYEDSNYGIEGYTEIRADAEDAGICFGLEEKVKETDNDVKLRKVVDDLIKRKNTKGGGMFTLFDEKEKYKR
jgi:metabotropic X receptor